MTTAIKTDVTKLSLAQAKAHEIRQKLEAEVHPAIRTVEAELAQIDSTKANWQDTASNPIAVERLEEDRQRLLNRRAILTDARDRAEKDLRQAEAQVEVDELAELRAEFERIGAARIQSARDVEAAAHMLAAKITEVEHYRVQMVGVLARARRFFLGRATGAEEMRRSDGLAALERLLKTSDVQGAVECILAAGTPAHVWDSGVRSEGGRVPDAVQNVTGQCRGGLIDIDNCMKRLISDAQGA